MTQEELEQEYPWMKQPEWQATRRLAKVSKTEYPRLWNELNEGGWPEELGEIPEGKPRVEMDGIPYSIFWDAMNHIECQVGRKACLRYSHKRNGDTDQMFEDWWDSQTDTKKLTQSMEQERNHRADRSGDEGSRDRRDFILTALLALLSFTVGFFTAGFLF